MSTKHLIERIALAATCPDVAAQDAQPTIARLNCNAQELLLCRYATLAACGTTEWPGQQDDNPCCPNAPTCRLPTNCTDVVVKACDIAHLPVCAPNTDGSPSVPTRASASSCCPVCRPAPPRQDRCTADPDSIPRCPDGVVPALVPSTGCLNCRPDGGRIGNCTIASFASCSLNVFPTLPTCTGDDQQRQGQDNTNPVAGTGAGTAHPCCLTCKPAYLGYCNATTIAACHQNHPFLPICSSGQLSQFNRPTCCRTCRRAPPSSPPDASGLCTKAQMQTCFRNIPVCEDGERPYVANGTSFCCPECRRAERTCSIEDVVRCRSNQPTCAAGELPSHVDGECCATCEPPKAACTCDPSQVCVYQRDVSITPTCAPALTVTFTVAPASANLDVLTFADVNMIGHLIREMVFRFCDHNRNDARCQARATQIRNSAFSYVANADGSYTVTVTFPDVADDDVTAGGSVQPTQSRPFVPAGLKGLLEGKVYTVSTSADAAIYFDAASDSESGDGYDASQDSAAPRGAAAGALSVVLALVAAAAMTAF